jgi:hypothetical protein
MLTRLIVLAAVAWLWPGVASAGFVVVTDRNDIATPDTLDWATLGGSGTSLPSGQTITSAGGRTATLPQGGTLLIVGFNVGFNAGFDIGQIVLFRAASTETIIQSSTPVSAAGAQFWGTNVASAVTLTALDASGNEIAGSSFSPAVGGGAGNVSFGSAGFVGLQGTSGQTFYGLKFSSSPQAYAINFVSFTPADASTAITTPAPAGLISGVIGISVLLGYCGLRGRMTAAV